MDESDLAGAISDNEATHSSATIITNDTVHQDVVVARSGDTGSHSDDTDALDNALNIMAENKDDAATGAPEIDVQSVSDSGSAGPDVKSDTKNSSLLARTLFATILCGAISFIPLYFTRDAFKSRSGTSYVLPESNSRHISASSAASKSSLYVPDNSGSMFSDKTMLEDIISSYARVDSVFHDNSYYTKLREHNALKIISRYLRSGMKSDKVLVVDKTFQKAMVFGMKKELCLYPKDSLESFRRQGRDVALFCNNDDYVVESVKNTSMLFETDCSTGRNSGEKRIKDDLKTPEGKFTIYQMQDSHDWTYDGKLAYGPKFFRIQNSIGVHGNGTDTSAYADSKKDKRYSSPESLGIYDNNFGHGRSHGCVRLDNVVLKRMADSGLIYKGMDVIVYEDKELTSILSKCYSKNKSYIEQSCMK
jgi:hypothetical protein